MCQVTTFCDNDVNNAATLHNDEAPNVHNNLCGGRLRKRDGDAAVDIRGRLRGTGDRYVGFIEIRTTLKHQLAKHLPGQVWILYFS